MRVVLFLQRLLATLAVTAYAANGAQAHLVVSEGDTITLHMCTSLGTQTETITLGGGGLEETSETCCGDCTAPIAIKPQIQRTLGPVAVPVIVLAARGVDQISPRSPLWPGAPPQGPPYSLNRP
ncbi:MAG: hypothetical protein AAF296_13350 [Pseudomonadota bacterium]